MRPFRAPIVAFALLGVVVAGAIADGVDAPERPSLAAAPEAPSTTQAPPPATSTAVPAPTTTTTVDPFVEGDDDPEAIDNRTWTWDQLADCESGAWGADRVPIPGIARWDATRSIYQGGLQFAAGTWDAYKEPGHPEDAHHATREQQIAVAEKVIQRQGPRAWPTCAPRLGMVGSDLPLDAPVEPSVPIAEALP